MCVCLPENRDIYNLSVFARATGLIHDLTPSGFHDNILSTRMHFTSVLRFIFIQVYYNNAVSIEALCVCAHQNLPLNIVSYVFAGVSFKNLETFSLLVQPSSAVGAETPSFFVPQPPSVINKDHTTMKHFSFISGFSSFSCLAKNLFVFLHIV